MMHSLFAIILALATAALTRNTSIDPRETPQICNNYAEFCSRKYSNITEICAHNSPFSVPNSISSNQIYDVTLQLNDGIRMLEGQTHMQNGTLHFCHTYCELLDAGPVENYFRTVSNWLASNPNEVVTIVIANGDNSPVGDFIKPIQDSGLGKYTYEPPSVPMTLNLWPTLGELISDGHRAIVFMDTGANQNEVPYILDQYSQLWETPFSPTDANFPCTVNRPPGLSGQDAKNRLYLANHNLNTNLNISGLEVLIPDLTNINRTNGETGFGSLGQTVQNCESLVGRPPNFLVVDYYNYGSPSQGSVFEVAAEANGVTYTRTCCGSKAATVDPTSFSNFPMATSSAIAGTTSTSSTNSPMTTSSGSGGMSPKDSKSWKLCCVAVLGLLVLVY